MIQDGAEAPPAHPARQLSAVHYPDGVPEVGIETLKAWEKEVYRIPASVKE